MRKDFEPKSLIRIISEDEFLPFLQDTCQEFFKVYNTFDRLVQEKSDVTKKFYSHLVQEAEFLESFLDEHGGRENRTWSFFSEYVASIRNLGIAAFYITHLLDRYPYYNLPEPDLIKEPFFAEAKSTLEFLDMSMLNLFAEAAGVGRHNRLVILNEFIDPDEFPEIQSNKRLPKTVTEDKVKDEEDRVVDLCEKIRKVSEMIGDIFTGKTDELEKLRKIIPHSINEKNARMFANQIHSVQSDFDTYIKNTLIEQKYPHLKNIRGYISLSLHLQEVVLWLSHFYERHEDDIREGECKTRISTLVNKSSLLGKINNFAFYYCMCHIQEGEKLCKEILSKMLKTVRYELPIPKPHGFHARPSTYLSLIAREHGKDVFMVVDGEKFNIKSVMSLLQAGGMVADKGYLRVVFEGDKKVLDDIKILADHNYCEDAEIPSELKYLKALLNNTSK